MSFSTLAGNQMVTEGDAAGATFPLKPGQSHGSGIKCMTRSEANARYQLNTSVQVAGTNQLMQKSEWLTGGYIHMVSADTLPYNTAGEACADAGVTHAAIYSANNTVAVGDVMYENSTLSTLYNGQNKWLHLYEMTYAIRTSSAGVVQEMTNCTTLATYVYTFSMNTTGEVAACGLTVSGNAFYAYTSSIGLGTYLYVDSSMTIPVSGSSDPSNPTWYKSMANGPYGSAYSIDQYGQVIAIEACPNTATGVAVNAQRGTVACNGTTCGLNGSVVNFTLYTVDGTMSAGMVIYADADMTIVYTTSLFVKARFGTGMLFTASTGVLNNYCFTGDGC